MLKLKTVGVGLGVVAAIYLYWRYTNDPNDLKNSIYSSLDTGAVITIIVGTGAAALL